MRLNVEVCEASDGESFVWRLRSDDTEAGDTFLAIGRAATREHALWIAGAPRDAVSGFYGREWRCRDRKKKFRAAARSATQDREGGRYE